jgi:hypothetical protein
VRERVPYYLSNEPRGTTTAAVRYPTRARDAWCGTVIVRVVLLSLSGQVQLCVSFSEHPNVDGDELADPKTRIVHQSDDRVVSLSEILRALLVAGVPQAVDLIGREPDFRPNFGIYI